MAVHCDAAERVDMKARVLKQILENTGYCVAEYETYIGIGSSLCHNLFSIDKQTFEIKYALDTFNKGRQSLEGRNFDHGLFIWDKLHELVAGGEIKTILEGDDILENPLPVFTVEKGELIATFTDAYGWPNVTISGQVMHDFDYFKTAKEALDWGVKECEANIKWRDERVVQIKEETERKVNELLDDMIRLDAELNALRKAQSEMKTI